MSTFETAELTEIDSKVEYSLERVYEVISLTSSPVTQKLLLTPIGGSVGSGAAPAVIGWNQIQPSDLKIPAF